VLRSRLETEYNVETTITNLPYTMARWVDMDVDLAAKLNLPSRTRLATDTTGRAVILFSTSWELELAEKDNPAVTFSAAS